MSRASRSTRCPRSRREEGVDFFLARARAVKPDFGGDDAVAEICRRLDDLPLALELAAARVKALSPAQILERLEQRLPLLTGGARDAPERQRTLRATIEWSYDLLDRRGEVALRPARGLPRRLHPRGGRGGRRREPRRPAVARRQEPAPALRRSASGCWRRSASTPPSDSSIQGDGDSLRQRHADYFLRLAEEAEPHLTGSQQAPWLERLEAEHDNFRLSLDSLRRADRGDEELRLVGALMRFWYVHGHLREGSSRCEEALAAHDDQSQPRLKALFGAALLAHRLGDYQRAEALVQERLELARRLGDAEAVASSLIGLGLSAHGLGDHERAAAACTESAELARAGGYTWFLAIATDNLGDLLRGAGRLRAGEGSPRGSPRTLPSARRRENGRRRSSSISAPSRLARAGATRPRHSCVESSRVCPGAGRQGAGDLVPERAGRRSRSPKATRSGRPG